MLSTAHRRTLLLTAVGLLALTAGCSELTAKVSGQVKLDGKPLEVKEGQRGTVVFRPVEGGPTTTGIIAEDGSYSLSTGSVGYVKPGDYLVAVRVSELTPSDMDNEAPSGSPITPAVYADPLQSGFQFAVKSGENKFDLELDSDAGPVRPIAIEAPAGGDAESEDAETEQTQPDVPVDEMPVEQLDEVPNADAPADPEEAVAEESQEVTP